MDNATANVHPLFLSIERLLCKRLVSTRQGLYAVPKALS